MNTASMSPAKFAAWEAANTHLDDDHLLADAEEAEEAAKSKPIYRMPSAHQVRVLLVNVESEREAYQKRTGCSTGDAYAWETGYLRGLLRAYLSAAETVERGLMRELQLALNETCNHYHNEGHAARVEKQYGLVMEEA